MVVEFCIGPQGGAECLLAQYMPSVKTMAFLAHVNTQSISRLQFFLGGGLATPFRVYGCYCLTYQ